MIRGGRIKRLYPKPDEYANHNSNPDNSPPSPHLGRSGFLNISCVHSARCPSNNPQPASPKPSLARTTLPLASPMSLPHTRPLSPSPHHSTTTRCITSGSVRITNRVQQTRDTDLETGQADRMLRGGMVNFDTAISLLVATGSRVVTERYGKVRHGCSRNRYLSPAHHLDISLWGRMIISWGFRRWEGRC